MEDGPRFGADGRWTGRAAAVIVAVAAACGGAAEPEPPRSVALVAGATEVELAVGESVAVESTDVRITFLGVREDSRCPADVTCVWAGDAEVALEAARPEEPPLALALHTTLEPRERVVAGVGVRLLDVLPEPRSDAPIPAGDYRVRLRLERG